MRHGRRAETVDARQRAASAPWPTRRGLWRTLVLLVPVVLVVGAILLDWRALAVALSAARWEYLLLALGFTFLSYGCLSVSFGLVSRLFGIETPWRELLVIGYVSTAMNQLLTLGGTVGHGIRLLSMQRRGAAAPDVLAASLCDGYLNLAVLPLLLLPAIGDRWLVSLVLVAVVILAGLVMLSRAVRVRLLRAVLWVGHRTRWGGAVEDGLRSLDLALARGVAGMRERPLVLLSVLGLIVVDWGSSALALQYCFAATGGALRLHVLLAGYATGVALGLLSMLPGGLGVQDVSMSGTYALLGVGFGRAVIAALLFRLVFYLAPSALSVPLYHRLMKSEA